LKYNPAKELQAQTTFIVTVCRIDRANDEGLNFSANFCYQGAVAELWLCSTSRKRM